MQINTNTENTETNANAVGTKTKVFSAKVPDGIRYDIEDGALLVMKLLDSSSAEIENNSKVYIAVKPPIKTFPAKTDEKSYRVFRSNTIQEQYNDEKNQKQKLELDGGGLSLLEGETFEIWLDSPTEIDPANCTFELNDVQKKAM